MSGNMYRDVSSALHPFYCKYCPLSFHNVDTYKRHTANHKMKYKKFRPKANSSLISMVNMVIQIISVKKTDGSKVYAVKNNTHEEEIKPNAVENERYEEKILPYAVKNDTHKLETKIDPDRPHKCKLCSKAYTRNFDLKRHVIKIHKNSGTNVETSEKIQQYKIEMGIKSTQNYSMPGRITTTSGKKKRTKKRPYECEYCPKSFQRVNQLWGHIRVHREAGENYKQKKVLRCEFCPKRFAYQCDLSKHISSHKQEKRYQCPHCEKFYSSSSQLSSHIRSQTRYKIYGCPLCEEKFFSKCKLNLHLQIYHIQKDKCYEVTRPHQCPMCNNTFKEQGHLTQHINKLHRVRHSNHNWFNNSPEGTALPHQCQKCYKCFKKRKYLMEHLKRLHPSLWKKQSGVNKSSKSSGSAIKAAIAISDRYNKCPLCYKIFSTKLSFRRHMRRKHKTSISLSQQLSPAKPALPDGIRHEGISKLFNCKYCSKVFVLERNLDQHVLLKHVKVKESVQYKCGYCLKVFGERSQLSHHMRSNHMGEEI